MLIMKSIYILSALMVSTCLFSQQLSKKEAYQRFKDSNVRKSLGIKLKDFDYNEIVRLSNNLETPIKDMIIFHSYSDKRFMDFVKCNYYQGTTINKNTKTPYCDDCSTIIYYSYKDAKDFSFHKCAY